MAIPIASSPPPGWDPEGIDLLLGLFPEGQLSEIVGPWSSGTGSLLIALLARATATGRLVALVDAGDAFDPASAVAAGADLAALLWVRCGGRLKAAFGAADLLARCPGLAVVALDLGDLPVTHRHPVPPVTYLRLQRAVEGNATILVLRTPHRMAGSVARLVVSVRGLTSRWIGLPRPMRLAGVRSEIEMLRSKAVPPSPHPSPAEGGRGSGRVWSIEWRL
jgi:hypothetical protein